MQKRATSLFGLLLCGIAFSTSAQIGSPVPPATGTWANVYRSQHLRQPELPPAGGFWVSEDNLRKTSPVIVRYYDDQLRQLQVDTLQQNQLNLKSRAVIHQLNERLTGLLQRRQQPVALTLPE